MVARLGPGERQHRGRKKHGLVVRVRNEQADALVGQRREARLHEADRVRVNHGEQHRKGSDEDHGQSHSVGCRWMSAACGVI